MAAEQPKKWSKWLPLAEWWYYTSHHSAINSTPYEAVYGQVASTHLPYLARESQVGVLDRSLQARGWDKNAEILFGKSIE